MKTHLRGSFIVLEEFREYLSSYREKWLSFFYLNLIGKRYEIIFWWRRMTWNLMIIIIEENISGNKYNLFLMRFKQAIFIVLSSEDFRATIPYSFLSDLRLFKKWTGSIPLEIWLLSSLRSWLNFIREESLLFSRKGSSLSLLYKV